MKIAILSRNEHLYSTRRLKEAGESRGHEMTVIDILKCYMNITAKKPTIYHNNQTLGGFDAIIPRISNRRTYYGCAVVRQLETSGTYIINSSLAITRSRDKLRAHQLLSMKGIDMPITGFAHSPNDVIELIKLIGGPSFIIKLLEGTQGVGVVLAETKKAAESVIQTLMGLNANIIIQEYIKEAEGADIRCFVVGNKVVAAMKRQAEKGEFRANIHQGGLGETISVTAAEKHIAIKAAKIMGLHMAGVDLLRSNRGPLVLEMNSSPGLGAIEKTTGVDIALKIIQHIEKHAKPIGPHSRYQG